MIKHIAAILNLSAAYDITKWWSIVVRAVSFHLQYGNYFLHPESNSAFSVGGQVKYYTETGAKQQCSISTFKKKPCKFKKYTRNRSSYDS